MILIPIFLFLVFFTVWAIVFIHRSRNNDVSKFFKAIMQWLKGLDQEAAADDNSQGMHTLNDLQSLITNSGSKFENKINWRNRYALKLGAPLLILPTAIFCSGIIYIGNYQPAFSIPAAVFVGLAFLIVGICTSVYLIKSYQSQAVFPQFLTQNKLLDMSKAIRNLRIKITVEIILWEFLIMVFCATQETFFYLAG